MDRAIRSVHTDDILSVGKACVCGEVYPKQLEAKRGGPVWYLCTECGSERALGRGEEGSRGRSWGVGRTLMVNGDWDAEEGERRSGDGGGKRRTGDGGRQNDEGECRAGDGLRPDEGNRPTDEREGCPDDGDGQTDEGV